MDSKSHLREARRQPRGTRRRGVDVHLTPRDKALLKALARFRVARTSDLIAYAFSGVRTDTARDRLRRLFDAGYLAVHQAGFGEENVYGLGPRGKHWLKAQGRSIGRVPRGSLHHHLAIVRTWIEIAGLVGEASGLVLRAARPDWELRQAGIDRVGSVIPDLLVRIGGSQGEALLAIEVDLGTEPLGVLRKKLVAYGDLGNGGMTIVLGMALGRKGVGRRPAVARLLEGCWGGISCTWTIEQGPGGVIRGLVTRLGPPRRDSPYGKGRTDVLSRLSATGEETDKEGL